MFNIFSHQGNTSQSNIEILSHLCQNDNYQENKKTIDAGEDADEKELLYTVGANIS
jgi:hypothetical protein